VSWCAQAALGRDEVFAAARRPVAGGDVVEKLPLPGLRM